MKTTLVLTCLMLPISSNAFAHPEHGTGVLAMADPLLGIIALIGLGLSVAAVRIYRRRKSVRADD